MRMIAVSFALLILPTISLAESDKSAVAIVDKAIAAQGGIEKLASTKANPGRPRAPYPPAACRWPTTPTSFASTSTWNSAA